MTLFGMEFTKYSLMGGAAMLLLGIIDYVIMSKVLLLGEKNAEREGTLDAEKAQAFARIRTVLAVICFLGFPVAGLLATDMVVRAVF